MNKLPAAGSPRPGVVKDGTNMGSVSALHSAQSFSTKLHDVTLDHGLKFLPECMHAYMHIERKKDGWIDR